MTKIVHVITTIDRGGAENAVLLLAKLQRRQGNQVIVVPLKGLGELRASFEGAGVTCEMNLINRGFLAQFSMFKRHYKEDVIFHGHLPRAELLIALTKRSSRLFVTRHNAEQFYPGAPSLLSRFLSRFVAKSVEGVVAISKTVREYLIESKEVGSSKISVIYYGYEAKRPTLDVKTKHDESINKLKLVCVSRLAPQKNLHFLLRLLRSLQDDKIESSLDIFGSGDQLGELRDYAKRLNLSNVTFCGKTDKVVDLLPSYDFFVLTSRYEGFGLVLLEAMDASIPIVAPRVSAIPEILSEDHIGLFESENLSDCKSKILHLYNSPLIVRNLVNFQKKRLSLFSSESYLASHNLLYGGVKLD